jgi:heme ABC exporter ATP-binding subunit CcmA
MDAAVELRDAVAVLGSFPALAGADLTVHRGDIVLLQGPNGAGKTTLLRVCAGLVPLTRGFASVLGLDVATQRDAVRNRVGFIGHANGLYQELTVRENVDFWAATSGADPDEVTAVLQQLGLAGRLADVTVSRLSAGQRRRTALACLVARRAEVWMLDEPHAGLDAAARDRLDDTLRVAAGAGATILMASHELDRATRLATRVVEVVAGTVREVS